MSVFVQMVSSEPPNFFLSFQLGIVMHHHVLECMQKDWLAVFKVKIQGHSKGSYDQKYDSLNYIC